MSLLSKLHGLLDNPVVYNVFQRVVSIGRMEAIRFFEEMIQREASGRVCDIGCGTGNYSHLVKEGYFGLDKNLEYIIHETNKNYVCSDATITPFANGVFDFVYSIGFFHHLDDKQSGLALKEIRRIIKPGGHIIIVEIFYPENVWNVFGHLLCRFDRGRFVRNKKSFKKMLSKEFKILNDNYILNSFPQNMRYFCLEAI